MNRRTLLNTFGMGLGGFALNEMLCKEVQAVNGNGALQHVHHAPKAKRVITFFRPADLLNLICLITSQRLSNVQVNSFLKVYVVDNGSLA